MIGSLTAIPMLSVLTGYVALFLERSALRLDGRTAVLLTANDCLLTLPDVLLFAVLRATSRFPAFDAEGCDGPGRRA